MSCFASTRSSALLVLLVCSTWAAPLGAQPDARPRRLELDADTDCATAEERATLLEALQLRLPGLMVERRGSGAPDTPVLTWASGGDRDCLLVLTTPSGSESLPLGPGAGEAELRAAAIRLAWWLEASSVARPDAWAQEVTPRDLTTPEPLPDPDPDPQPARVAAAPHHFIVTAQFGASYYPTPGKAPGVVRLLLTVPLNERVQIGLEGRLVTELSIPSNADVDALDRSLGLLGRYQDRVAERWLVDVSLGLRYAFPQVEADQGESAEIEEPIANLMIFTGIGLGFELVHALRLKADLLGAVAFASRQIAVPRFPAAEIGVLNLELLVGFELAF